MYDKKGLDFKHKEVINVNDGKRLGHVQDVCADLKTGKITATTDSDINNYLKPDGYAILEIGFDQKEDLQNLFKDAKCIKDLGNNDRVIIWKNCRKDSI